MASLGSLLVSGDGTSPLAWAAQNWFAIDEAIASANDADDVRAVGGTNNNDTSFLLADMPGDFSAILTLSHQVRYKQSGRVDDTVGLQIRVMSGATVLAAADSGGTFASVAAGITSTTYANSSVTAFAYVNTGASKATWDAAQVELRQTYTVSMSADSAFLIVSTLELTGTYTPTAVRHQAYWLGRTTPLHRAVR